MIGYLKSKKWSGPSKTATRRTLILRLANLTANGGTNLYRTLHLSIDNEEIEPKDDFLTIYGLRING